MIVYDHCIYKLSVATQPAIKPYIAIAVLLQLTLFVICSYQPKRIHAIVHSCILQLVIKKIAAKLANRDKSNVLNGKSSFILFILS